MYAGQRPKSSLGCKDWSASWERPLTAEEEEGLREFDAMFSGEVNEKGTTTLAMANLPMQEGLAAFEAQRKCLALNKGGGAASIVAQAQKFSAADDKDDTLFADIDEVVVSEEEAENVVKRPRLS